MHDMPDNLTEGLPNRFLTMDEAVALDEYGAERFFPLLSIGGFDKSGKVIAGYAKTKNGHFLLALDEDDKSWHVVEKNDETASFDHGEDGLLQYVCNRSNIEPSSVFGYDSNDPEYPQLG